LLCYIAEQTKPQPIVQWFATLMGFWPSDCGAQAIPEPLRNAMGFDPISLRFGACEMNRSAIESLRTVAKSHKWFRSEAIAIFSKYSALWAKLLHSAWGQNEEDRKNFYFKSMCTCQSQ
jgi:hypothetical protein